ncbi:hypothetical protein OAR38_03825 [Flavobacteriaceae bacterium]|jgi:hypothetical protein|nr:hypothetical protein [Flavobacteriaceae bacterium]MDB0042926.1 hypothetical protein [Flavobacteriaceae bacterium]MDB4049924.1 hypothetical protein [Flavobacteriaceae bacterium]MDB4087061.1 hypothetical protein [Flavobacteriaceae bacterium]MDB4240078.1 hypothetical protein [Flavobacteriaceae bacterium]
MNLIKLIWDFKGPVSNKTALHFHSHLKEFLALEKMYEYKTGLEENSDHHSIVFVITNSEDLDFFKKKLKPNRGQKVS